LLIGYWVLGIIWSLEFGDPPAKALSEYTWSALAKVSAKASFLGGDRCGGQVEISTIDEGDKR